jgi:alpha-L-fucosidase 2
MKFEDYGPQRFQWFWKAGGDWIPDLDDGGTGMMTLEMMLMQTDGSVLSLGNVEQSHGHSCSAV